MQSWTLFAEFSDRIVCYVLQRICFHKPRSQIEDSYITNMSGSASEEEKNLTEFVLTIKKLYESIVREIAYVLYDAKPIIFALVYLPVSRWTYDQSDRELDKIFWSSKVRWANHTNSGIMLIDICKYPAFV